MSTTSSSVRALRLTGRPTTSVGRRLLRWLGESPVGWEAIFTYTVLALVFGRHVLPHLSSVCSCSQMSDSWEMTWPFEWFPYALVHGLNPWYTHAQWNPPGSNVAGVTSFPLLALALTPVTWLWGPLVSANLVNIGAPVVTGWATYQLCRYVSNDRAAAVLGGATVGFGAYVILHMWAGHVLLTVVVGPQFAALASLRYLDGATGRTRAIVELTLVLIVQLFISAEIFVTMTLFGAVLLMVGYGCAGPEARVRIRRLILPLAVAYATTLVLSSDYLYWAMKVPKYVTGIGSEWPTDLLSYVVPTTTTWIGGRQFASIYKLFDRGAESSAYLGVPLILITVRWLWVHRQSRLARFLATSTAISVLWTLGPTLYVANKPTVWLPYRLVSGLPLMDMILEGRIAFYTELLAAVMLTLWLADRKRRPVAKWCIALIAALAVFPNIIGVHKTYHTKRPIPEFFGSHMYRKYIKQGATVLPLSWGLASPDLMWQADDGMYYRLASGYFTLTLPPGWASNQIIDDLWNNLPQRSDGRGFRELLMRRDVDDVVVLKANLPKWRPMLRAAGLTHPRYLGGVYLYPGPW